MLFKGISHLELWQPFGLAERNHSSNFCRGYQEEQFGEIILNLGLWFRRCPFLSGALVAFPFGEVEWNHLCNFKRTPWGTFM